MLPPWVPSWARSYGRLEGPFLRHPGATFWLPSGNLLAGLQLGN